MEVVVGNVYKFEGELGSVVFKILEEHEMAYSCKVISSNIPHMGEVGSTRLVYKQSKIFREYKMTHVSENNRRKRRAPEEIQMDKFLDGILLKQRISKLKHEIDVALAAGDKKLFMELTKELKKLTKKEVTV